MQANESGVSAGEEFDPTLYGMAAEYDEAGNYKYPEGFDPETNDWLPGYEKQRETWEQQYAEAHARWESHKKQVAEQRKADAEAGVSAGDGESGQSYTSPAPEAEGTLATDKALQALRDKLTGN